MQPEKIQMQRRAARRANQQMTGKAAHHGHPAPTERSSPDVSTGTVWAIASIAKREDLVAVLHQHG